MATPVLAVVLTGLIALHTDYSSTDAKEVQALVLRSDKQKTPWGDALPVHRLRFRDLGHVCDRVNTCPEQEISLPSSIALVTGSPEKPLSLSPYIKKRVVDLREIFSARLLKKEPDQIGGARRPLTIRAECLNADFSVASKKCKTRRPTFFLVDRPLLQGRVSVRGEWLLDAVEVDEDHNPEEGLDDSRFGLAVIDQERTVQAVVHQQLFTQPVSSGVLFLDTTGEAKAGNQLLRDKLTLISASDCKKFIGLSADCYILVIENHPEHSMAAMERDAPIVNETEFHASLAYELLQDKPKARPVPFLRLSEKQLTETTEPGSSFPETTTPPKFRCPPVLGFGFLPDK